MARLLGGILGVRIMCAIAIGMLNAAALLLAMWTLYTGLVGLSPVLVAAFATAKFTRVSGCPGHSV